MMPDWLRQALLMAAVAGVTNALQYVGVSVPAARVETEVAAANSTCWDNLQECYKELHRTRMECRP